MTTYQIDNDTQYPLQATPVTTDQILIIDKTAGAVKKVTFANATKALKASGAEVDTGTEDAKAVTPAALAASHNTPTVAPSTAGKAMLSDGTDWISAYPPYVLYGACGSTNPADGTTYYFGSSPSYSMNNTAASRRIYTPRAGTITRVDISIINAGGTQGTNETSTMYLRLNNTTDTTLSSAIVANTASGSATFFNVTGLSVAVAAGDYFEYKWVTPTWSTNPTNVIITAYAYISG